ncbi:MAG: DMT family transporter [Eubacteriales bacterium]|nr:DMT family transporter [Eubacteriales bacterium]
MSDQTRGFLYIIFGVTLLGLLSMSIKIIYGLGISERNLTPLFTLIIAIVSFMNVFKFKREKIKLKETKLKYMILQGVFGSAIYVACFYRSLIYLDASVSIMILYSNCIFVFLYETLIKRKKVSTVGIISLIVLLVGLILTTGVFSESLQVSSIGILYAIVASLGFAFQNINLCENLSDVDTTVSLLYTSLFSFITLVAFYGPKNIIDFQPTILNISVLLFIAVVTGYLPALLQYKGILLVGAYKASVISSLEIPITAVMAFFILSEKLNITQIIGMILIVTGSIYIQKNQQISIKTKTRNEVLKVKF